MEIVKIVNQMVAEFEEATEKYGKFNSFHEGYAVMKEELDELWEECKKWPKYHNLERMKKECVQIGAMAIRFIKDLNLK